MLMRRTPCGIFEVRDEQGGCAKSRLRGSAGRLGAVEAVIAFVVAMLVGSAALFAIPTVTNAALPSFTWSGGPRTQAFEAGWSNPKNWEGGTAPSGKVGTVAFPDLAASAMCSEDPFSACWESENNLAGLEVNAVSIDIGAPYAIYGNGITLGEGGLTVAPSGREIFFPVIAMPITLGAPQTWSIAGGAASKFIRVEGNISGSGDALTVHFTNSGELAYEGDAETGNFTASGAGTLRLGLFNNSSLNGSDGNQVELSGGANLVAPVSRASTGPLTITGGTLSIGTGRPHVSGDEGTGEEFLEPDTILSVNGGVALSSTTSMTMFIDSAGTTPGTDYTQVSATGTANLANADLAINLGETAAVEAGRVVRIKCGVLKPGDVDTLFTTTGSLTGTFAEVPDGTIVPLGACEGKVPTVRINYAAHTVTATVLTSGATVEEEEREAKEKAEREAKAKAEAEAKAKAEAEAAAKKKAEEEAAAKKHQEEAAAKNAVLGTQEATGGPSVGIGKVKVTAHSLVITIKTTQAGTVTISGPGLRRTVKTLAAGTNRVTVALTKAGKAARKAGKKIKLTVTLKSGGKTVSSSKKFKL
jgi:hypothetical protein